jgi:8-oxo-dGTP pyrophosphatase MutT (NUDIX family)
MSADPDLTAPQRRRAARVLLFDDHDAVLLFHEPSRPDRAGWWYTPGGELGPGETEVDAARRELLEETGIVAARLAGPIALRSASFAFDGRWIDQDELIFAGWVSGEVVVRSRPGDLEAAAIAGHRWWTAEELRAIEETTYPGRMGELVARVLREGIPSEPWSLTD